jgi:hypothetical protein
MMFEVNSSKERLLSYSMMKPPRFAAIFGCGTDAETARMWFSPEMSFSRPRYPRTRRKTG